MAKPKYILMHKDIPVLRFTYDTAEQRILSIVDVMSEAHAPLSVFMRKNRYERKLAVKALDNWWQDRCIPRTRENIKPAIKELNLTSAQQLMLYSNALSLSDQYWVYDEADLKTWENVNFFSNDFDDSVGYTLVGDNSKGPKPSKMGVHIKTPDAATNGDQRKMWHIEDDGRRVLLKAGNISTNQEAFNEVIATELFSRLMKEDEYTHYTIRTLNNLVYSSCDCMVDDTHELIPAWQVYELEPKDNADNKYMHYVKQCQKMGLDRVDTELQLDKMNVGDFILSNFDRHWSNFGVIRNSDTLQVERLAPVYDTGACLYPTVPYMPVLNTALNQRQSWGFNRRLEKTFANSAEHGLDWYNPDKMAGFSDYIRETLERSPVIEAPGGRNRINILCADVNNRLAIVKDERKAQSHDRVYVPEVRRTHAPREAYEKVGLTPIATTPQTREQEATRLEARGKAFALAEEAQAGEAEHDTRLHKSGPKR
jgi:hypothetical protein